MKTETSDLPEVSDISWMFKPISDREVFLRNRRGGNDQEVWATIGCPGSGKSTMSQKLDPSQWTVLTLDDWRTAIWPPHRRIYWQVRETERGPAAQAMLRDVHMAAIHAALTHGWNVFLADTHIKPSAFHEYVRRIRMHGIQVKWKLFDVPFEVIMERNKTRPEDHRLPEEVLLRLYKDMWSKDAWWRSIPSDQIEVIKSA